VPRVEGGLERGQGLRPPLLQLLAQRLGARAQLCVRRDLVDEAHRLRLLRGVLAVEVPDLLGPLAAHRVANYYHTEEAKEMGRAFNSKQDPDPDKFYK
jgi:1,4-dihydroxy-2-naphthoyl-CoA synthase